MRLNTLIPLIALAGLLPASADATPACRDFWPNGEFGGLLPEDGETDVPVDTLIWFGVQGAVDADEDEFPVPDVVLRDEAGDLVALEEHGRLGAGSTHVIAWRPADELQPLGAYTLEATWGDDGSSDDGPEQQTWSRSFVVGEGASEGSPEAPTFARIGLETYGNRLQHNPCYSLPPQDSVEVELEGSSRVALVLLSDEQGQPGPADPFDGVTAARLGVQLTIRDELPPHTKVHLRAGTFDLAGNFSGWSEQEQASMPAAGCASTIAYDQAALGLALLVVGGGLLRRRRELTRLAPVLLAGALGAATLAPSAASAAEVGISATATVPVASTDWRTPMERRLKTAEHVWGGLALGGGAVQLGFTLALPSRAPGALQGTIGGVIGWGPALAGLATTGILRHRLKHAASARALERELLAVFFVTAGLCTAALVAATAGAIVAGALVDPGGGMSVAMMGGALSMLSANLNIGVAHGQLRRARVGQARRHGRPAPQLLAAAPTGLVVVF